ncbi:hypothetical protein C8R45DRAFT_1215357 [Mycena sanguinolenta]|nr:hypothetical protein C8R45DRAFT_1215357 [Mycena sanguinolenta]
MIPADPGHSCSQLPWNPSPFFPPELERETFETTAYLYPKTIFNLIRVSRRVQEWIDGVQYATVMDSSTEGSLICPVEVLLRVILSESKPASFFQRHVRNVHYIWDRRDRDNILAQVLPACSGIHNLVLGTNSPALGSLLPTLAAMQPRRLTLARKPSLDSHAPMFTFLTHFHILRSSLPADGGAFPSFLAHLPALTYFAIILRSTVLILIANSSTSLAHLPSVDDPRFLYQWVRFYAFIDVWIPETRGGIDFWARGDAFVAKKRRGEIQPVSRCRIDVGDP